MIEHESTQGKKIVFFDGVCGLCNGSVDFLIRIDTKNQLFFSPQQGQLFQSPFIQKLIRPEMGDSIFYLKDQTIYFKSDAIIRILIDVGGVWKVAWLFNIIPLRVRNLVYDFIAQNRYRWFGKKNQCRVPSWKEKAKFLN
jgi:predicted DCC family thiol-disulfide oxidoreductase YuxK